MIFVISYQWLCTFSYDNKIPLLPLFGVAFSREERGVSISFQIWFDQVFFNGPCFLFPLNSSLYALLTNELLLHLTTCPKWVKQHFLMILTILFLVPSNLLMSEGQQLSKRHWLSLQPFFSISMSLGNPGYITLHF